ncbi:proline dehydrogenase family protein [Bacillus piscicola]|uniref:proline dehydrogenase family protein n=1 Tax=Bacillus piscicola TaxID=1632684 RepID=UPI001F092F5A|nr:proline dehydrogenase family protein [Bacillus piscicola]
MHKFSRRLFLSLSENRFLAAAARKWGLSLGASKVVSGESLESAIAAVRSLNETGIAGTITHLGEFNTNKSEADQAAAVCIQAVEKIAESAVDCHLSIKLTQIGLGIDLATCLHHLKDITKAAHKHGIFLQIDMESFFYYESILYCLQQLRREFDNVGTVVQASLHRAEDDVRGMQDLHLRLVKGAYKEAPDYAFQTREEIDENFFKLIQLHVASNGYTAIATHDHNIIEKVKLFTSSHHISIANFEFQLLYGFREELQKQLVEEGYRVRAYIPFGSDWYGYFMRRLAERPQNITFALKGFFSK